MDAAAYLGLLRRRWLPLLACILAGVAGAVSITRDSPKVYASSTQLFINIPAAREVGEALQGVQLSTQLLASYARVATSRSAAAEIVERLKLDYSPDQLRANLGATPVPETLLLTIGATDLDPRRAQRITQAAAAVFIENVRDLEPTTRSVVKPRVIDPAQVSFTPVSPRPGRNVTVGLGLGLLVGLAVALVLEALDRSIRTPGEAEALSGAPVLAIIPRRRDAKSRELLGADAAGTAAAEAYRVIRTSVRFMDLDRPIRTLVVSSPSPGDGKTSTAANLALAMAEGGERVVLVDGDLRRSRLPALFGIDSSPGLTSVIIGQVDEESPLRRISDRLVVLPPGPLPPNPSEILGSRAMAHLIATLRGIADVVVFDAPPILPVTDAQVLATQVDGVILVVRHGRTQRSLVEEARRRLDVVGGNVIGCVLNGVPASSDYSDEYRYTSTAQGTGSRGLRLTRRRRGEKVPA